jgi:hypothetical protein
MTNEICPCFAASDEQGRHLATIPRLHKMSFGAVTRSSARAYPQQQPVIRWCRPDRHGMAGTDAFSALRLFSGDDSCRAVSEQVDEVLGDANDASPAKGEQADTLATTLHNFSMIIRWSRDEIDCSNRHADRDTGQRRTA